MYLMGHFRQAIQRSRCNYWTERVSIASINARHVLPTLTVRAKQNTFSFYVRNYIYCNNNHNNKNSTNIPKKMELAIIMVYHEKL